MIAAIAGAISPSRLVAVPILDDRRSIPPRGRSQRGLLFPSAGPHDVRQHRRHRRDVAARFERSGDVAEQCSDPLSLVRGVILRQERMVRSDPYANAFREDYMVAERKFEIDSLCYPVKLAERYVDQTGDT